MSSVFIGDNPRLEAVFDDSSSEICVVITHPHSLMGGNMSNNVVMAAWKTAVDMGYSVLRFNFRGVGNSEGCFDNGIGEVSDLAAACNYAGRPVILVGYSFGSWVAARFLQNNNLPSILISPPNSMFSFPSMKNFNTWSVVGSQDQFCNPKALTDLFDSERITVIEDAGHFWYGEESHLHSYLQDKIRIISLTL